MRFTSLILVVAALAATPSLAQVSNPDMSCADYLKLAAQAGPTPKTGDAATDKMAADMDTKMKAYCTANPKAKAMEAAEKAMMGG
ncbi:hypothetical protein GCM10007301_19010 [Azorhizobium oxalatiphilum]|uniref:Acid stress chaperone HdeA n=1 Tax=Azorhizobium oxalatiphilum TaxID=980631 RepID=A0A917BUN6_9HYPH|nr:hypothetical protein [Azorhizobium oxalatiphilum]GGF59449.1 hypothetical protein GCM10007301_19010 [Azorhizobium oxalatiphilum]